MNASKTQWERQIANIIWMKLKGKEIPDSYSEFEVRQILDRYWHKAMESEQF